MHIDACTFGRMVVDGKAYTSDLLLLCDDVRSDWRRAHGHSLYEYDLKDILDAAPDVLVIGTGFRGRMRVPPETWEALWAAGIEVIIERTDLAAKTHNLLVDEGRNVAAAFHLTC